MTSLLRQSLLAFATITLLSLLAVIGGCSRTDSTDGDTLKKIRSTGVIRVGFANEAPYAYLDSQTGELTGEAPAVLNAIAKDLGVTKVEAVLTEFGSLIPGLQADRFDIIAAGMYITPERSTQILFSNPTYSIGEAFLVRSGNPLNLHSYEDAAKHKTARIGVVAGAIERDYARKVGIPDERVVVFPDAPSALAGVLANRIDAYAGTSLTVRDLLAKSGDDGLELAQPFTDPVLDGKSVRGYGAFGFRKQDVQLAALFNERLAGFIGTQAHLQAVNPFGFTSDELPGNVTAKDLTDEK